MCDYLKIPLVVGMSGHIDIATPENVIEAGLKEFWGNLRDLAGKNTPIILLSSIAAGADHLVVKYRPADVKYCAILPFDEKEYRKDFSGAALSDYISDHDNAYRRINCNASPGDYSAASDYVRKHSDVLLTLWDGFESLSADKTSPKKGGTYYQIMAAFKQGLPHLQFREKARLVVNLSVTRSREDAKTHLKNGEKDICGFPGEGILSVLEWDEENSKIKVSDFQKECERLKALPEKDETGTELDVDLDFPAILKHLRENNDSPGGKTGGAARNVYYLRDMFNRKIEEEKKAGGASPTERAFRLIEDDFLRHEFYDGLAGTHQAPHKKQFLRIALCSVVIGILGQAWGDLTFSPDDVVHEWIMHGVILLYLLSCLAILWYYRKTKKDAHYFQYVNPRLIAEMLRLKIFWKLSGIRDFFSDCFLDECDGYWFMVPICNWELADPPMPDNDRSWLESGGALDTVRTFWLEDQAAYYNGYLLKEEDDAPVSFIIPQKEEKCRRKRFLSAAWFREYFRKYERLDGYFSMLKTFFTWSAFILSVLLLVVFVLAQVFGFDHTEFLKLSCYREFIIGICPFIVASLGWMMEKTTWDQMAPQYRKALRLFRKANRYLGENHPVPDKQQIIRELVLYAHRENTEWNNIRNGAKPEPMI